jgi:lipopolysaccharide export system protein LptC
MNGDLSGQPVVIRTSTMSYNTQDETAGTPAPVTFDTRSGTLEARGLAVNFKDGSVRLESRVHGTFPPK